MIDKFGKAFLTMFGIGYVKFAPGTLASFVTCLIYLYFVTIKLSSILLIIIFIFILINSILLINKFSNKFSEIDAKEIVIDEFLGQSVPIIIFFCIFSAIVYFDKEPGFAYEQPDRFFFGIILPSFLFFRIFDILKPFPINIIDKKMKNGLGVVLDDVIAGVYAFCASCFTLYIYVEYFMD